MIKGLLDGSVCPFNEPSYEQAGMTKSNDIAKPDLDNQGHNCFEEL